MTLTGVNWRIGSRGRVVLGMVKETTMNRLRPTERHHFIQLRLRDLCLLLSGLWQNILLFWTNANQTGHQRTVLVVKTSRSRPVK